MYITQLILLLQSNDSRITRKVCTCFSRLVSEDNRQFVTKETNLRFVSERYNWLEPFLQREKSLANSKSLMVYVLEKLCNTLFNIQNKHLLLSCIESIHWILLTSSNCHFIWREFRTLEVIIMFATEMYVTASDINCQVHMLTIVSNLIPGKNLFIIFIFHPLFISMCPIAYCYNPTEYEQTFSKIKRHTLKILDIYTKLLKNNILEKDSENILIDEEKQKTYNENNSIYMKISETIKSMYETNRVSFSFIV